MLHNHGIMRRLVKTPSVTVLSTSTPTMPTIFFFTSFIVIEASAQCFRCRILHEPLRVALNRSTVVLIWRIKRHKPANRKNFMKHTLDMPHAIWAFRTFYCHPNLSFRPLVILEGTNSPFLHFNYRQLNLEIQ